ncbi:MAG: glycosyltransferase family 25 protein [Myxococcales bacterium]|nr:MAG: glycosyltransferase family 25 protein [Myxococcales bacterium]
MKILIYLSFTVLLTILFLVSCSSVDLKDFSALDIKYQFINLKTAKERRENTENQLKLAGLKYHIVDAVYGKDLSPKDIDTLVKNGIYAEKVKQKSILKPGEIGVYLSNIEKALPNAIKNRDSITVTFEDDVVIPIDIETQFKQALKATPSDWDILYLGCYNNYRVTLTGEIIGPYMPTSLKDSKIYKYLLCATDDKYRVAYTPWLQLDGSCIAGAYAYAVRGDSAKKIKEMLTPIRQPIDNQLTELIGKGKLNAYCLNPELVRVNTTIPSTIR